MKLFLNFLNFLAGALTLFVFFTGYQKFDDLFKTDEYIKEKRVEIKKELQKEHIPIDFEIFNNEYIYTSIMPNNDLKIFNGNYNELKIGSTISVYLKKTKYFFNIPYKEEVEGQLVIADFKVRKYILEKYDDDDPGFRFGEVQISGAVKYKSKDYVCFIFGKLTCHSKVKVDYFGVGYLLDATINKNSTTMIPDSKLSSNINSDNSNAASIYRKINYSDGIFDGFVANDLKIFGKYQWNSGKKYIGQWQNDLISGYGILTTEGGSQYFGSFSNNMKNGYGILIIRDIKQYHVNFCENCRYYVGYWVDDLKQGIGICYASDGSILYKGEFADSKPIDNYPNPLIGHRFENITYSNKNRYEGETYNGERDGYGIFYWVDGSCWFGIWEDNQRNGNGVYIENTGEVTTGKWIGDNKEE